MITGNKGEWSEIYTFLKLLGDGRIFAADENLNKIETMYFPILKILREEFSGKQYEYAIDDKAKLVRIFLNGNQVSEFQSFDFKNKADSLHKAIINSGKVRSFPAPEIENFMTKVECKKLKAPSSSKEDIKMQIHDINTGHSPISGFSIKSELGNMPTLLNATSATNFVYEIVGLSTEQTAKINSIETRTKIADRMKAIKDFGGVITFDSMCSDVFESNLEVVDSKLPELLGEALKFSYIDGIMSCSAMVEKLTSKNPLKVKNPDSFYGAKFKKFLTAVALGMLPAKKWDGKDEATGGYIIVTKTGDVLAYHIYNRDSFEEYLLRTTGYERPSTTRHGYASIYSQDGKDFIKLNMQIRFLR